MENLQKEIQRECERLEKSILTCLIIQDIVFIVSLILVFIDTTASLIASVINIVIFIYWLLLFCMLQYQKSILTILEEIILKLEKQIHTHKELIKDTYDYY